MADSLEIARRAAALVRVEYENVQRPILTIKEALKDGQTVKPDMIMHLEMKTGDNADGGWPKLRVTDDVSGTSAPALPVQGVATDNPSCHHLCDICAIHSLMYSCDIFL